jgi:signal transduction histidine kinase/ActR/RegA family two-component response regulator
VLLARYLVWPVAAVTALLLLYTHGLQPGPATRAALAATLAASGIYGTAMLIFSWRMVAKSAALECETRQQRQAAAQLCDAKEIAETASRAKTEFLATMSHELRTPLNAIIGFSEIMGAEIFGELGHPKYRGYAKDILDSGRHLLDLINDILDIAKAEAGTLTLKQEQLNVSNLLAGACRLLRPRIERAELTLAQRYEKPLPILLADARKVRQIVLNLLANAVKFTRPGGRIEVEAEADPERGLIITVADTGIGIAKEHLALVLQPFVQFEGALERSREGAGLGLPIVLTLMELHEGRLQLESEVGKGTRASVVFPPHRLEWHDQAETLLAQRPCAHIATFNERGTLQTAHRPATTVLLVEDDQGLLELLQRMLIGAGYEVVSARNGLGALERLRETVVDVVVTDMLMPEMDGIELMRALIVDRPSLPIVAISGVDDWAEYLRIATHLGAKATLRKPISAPRLREAVELALLATPPILPAQEYGRYA